MDKAIQASTLSMLYTNTTQSALISCITVSDLKSRRFNKKLMGKLSLVELHFPIFKSQLSASLTALGDKVEPGDVIITRHSTTPGFSILFTLVVDDLPISSSSPVIHGFKSILTTCLSLNISSLTIPVSLLSETRKGKEVGKKERVNRAEVVIKASRGIFSASARGQKHESGKGGVGRDHQSIVFVVGEEGGAFEKVRDVFCEVYRPS
jgi:hypothetical protein